MKGITFGTLHSYNDLGLILNKKTIGAPSVKTAVIDIPGSDGKLDYTEYFGEINYYNRNLSFEFSIISEPSEFLQVYSSIQNRLNGRKMNIYLDADPGFYYVGRISVNEWASSARIGKLVIDVDAEPYKLKTSTTSISANVSAMTVMNCTNLRKKVIPTITTSAEIKVAFGAYEKTFTGTITDENIVFGEGINALTFTPTSGSALVTVEYQEGGL